jgi:ribosomal protein L29
MTEPTHEDAEVAAELARFKAELAARRHSAAAEEAVRNAELAEYDRRLTAATDALDAKGRVMAAWDARWAHFRAAEQRVVDGDRRRFEQRWDVECSELEERDTIAASEDGARDAVLALEAGKRRYLIESTAWTEDWALQAEGDWQRYRADCVRHVSERRSANDEEEAELAALQAKLAKLRGGAAQV